MAVMHKEKKTKLFQRTSGNTLKMYFGGSTEPHAMLFGWMTGLYPKDKWKYVVDVLS